MFPSGLLYSIDIPTTIVRWYSPCPMKGWYHRPFIETWNSKASAWLCTTWKPQNNSHSKGYGFNAESSWGSVTRHDRDRCFFVRNSLFIPGPVTENQWTSPNSEVHWQVTFGHSLLCLYQSPKKRQKRFDLPPCWSRILLIPIYLRVATNPGFWFVARSPPWIWLPLRPLGLSNDLRPRGRFCAITIQFWI